MDSNRRVLIVDDQEDLRQQVARILEPKGGATGTSSLIEQIRSKISKNKTATTTTTTDVEYDVSTVGQGKDAYEMVKESFSDHKPFALMFLDMRMPPGWDGLETAQRIRAIDKDIQIVIMTAYADHEQREIAEKIGEPDKLLYIKKPFHPEEVRQLALAMTEKWNMNRREKDRLILTNRLMRENAILSRHRFKNLKESYRTVLDAFASFLDARFGMIVRQGQELEVCASTSATEAKRVLKKLSPSSGTGAQPTFDEKQGTAIFPFSSDNFDGFVYIEGKNLLYSFDQLRSFLDILIETAREVLTNAFLHQQQSVEKQLAAVGMATEKINSRFQVAVTQIRSYADSLADADDRELRKELANKIAHATDSVLRLTEEISIFSNEHGSQLAAEKHNIKEILSSSLGKLENRIAESGVQVEINAASDLTISCDRSQVEKVFDNVLLNAVEALDRAGPPVKELKVDAHYLNSFRNAISVSIRDNGDGIDETVLGHVFEPFVSLDPDKKNGLGVTIAKQLIDRHNGRLAYETNGDGTTFQIVLPISPDTRITGTLSGKLIS